MSFRTFLNEAPLPDDWQPENINGKQNFKQMIAYASSKAEKIGIGSSRVAFKIEYKGRPTVLKIAKNKKGIAQNKSEIKYLEDSYIEKLGIVIPMIDYDEVNSEPRWIHTEYAEKIKDSYFVKETGLNLYDLTDYCSEIAKGNKVRKGLSDRVNTESELVNSFMNLLRSFEGLILGDFRRAANWGLYKGTAVCIDLGLDTESGKLYYLSWEEANEF